MKSDNDILMEEARRFNYQALQGDKFRRHSYQIIASQLERGIEKRMNEIGGIYTCPTCGASMAVIFKHCPNCGQKLLWK